MEYEYVGEACLVNRSKEYTITVLVTDGSKLEIPPLHGADVERHDGISFSKAELVTPEELKKRYGE